jgi:hypothetical protein
LDLCLTSAELALDTSSRCTAELARVRTIVEALPACAPTAREVRLARHFGR